MVEALREFHEVAEYNIYIWKKENYKKGIKESLKNEELYYVY